MLKLLREMIRQQSILDSPLYHDQPTLWAIHKFCLRAKETGQCNKDDRKVFVDFVKGTLFSVPFFKNLQLLSDPNLITNTSERFKHYLRKCSYLICQFLNPGFEKPSLKKFATEIVLNEGFASSGDKEDEEEVIEIINLVTVEGILI
jgi:hypothetical protein